MPRNIFTGAAVQWAAIIRAALSLGCSAALLSVVVGIVHIGVAHSETNAPPNWVDPDRVTDLPLVAAEPPLPASASSARRTLSWDFLDHLARALTPDQHIRTFETIENLLHARQFVSASKLLERFEGVTLDHPQNALRHLLEVKTLYMSGEYRKALRALHRLPNQDLTPHHQATALWLETGSLLGVQQIPEALNMARNFAPNTHQFVAASVYEMIWITLRSIPTTELHQLRVATTDPYSTAWVALANQFASDPNFSQNFNRQLASWQRRNPNHPANRYVLLHIASKANPRIRQVALLLPITSSFTEAAQAIRDGFLFLSEQNDLPARPLIRIYDFGDQTELIRAYYDAAVRDQADFIVGPVGPAAVKALSNRNEFPVPTLLLGNLDHPDAARSNVYQFSLSPEDDATAVAERAFNDGHRRVVALYPDTSQGRRIFAAWSRKWQKHGGILIQSHAYDASVSDHTQILRALFHLDHSSARRKALQRTLGNTAQTKFLARRRQDIDALLLLGNSYQTRLIKPQIDFHHAHNLAVYGLNSNYTGTPDPVKDLDLEGIVFGDMPWVLNHGGSSQALRNRVPEQQSRNGTVLDRLFALGMDAYGLINNISEMQRNPDLTYLGMTGDLSVTATGRIQRRLEWFQIHGAKPVHLRLATLPTPPRLDLNSYPSD
ncbi:MAG: penicillin-binding protein activator [Pseudomonadota bacterium]|nr:penicillin-binding protein activator [Pseudomonadota bacterium]